MRATYFKRYRMEYPLYDAPPAAALPEGFTWAAWSDELLERHAEVKYACFHEQIDARVFPRLADRRGCRELMDEIRRRPGFLPEATWLVLGPAGWCGTVQGVRHAEGVGMVMNLGVVPRYRGRGIGTALLLQALHGFRRRGLGRAQLEVTAENQSAVRLYLQLGFRCRKTLYKAVDSSLQPSAAKMSNAALTPPALACAQLDSEHSFP